MSHDPRHDRRHQSLESLQGRVFPPLRGLDTIENLADKITRRAIVRGFLIGFTGLTVGCSGGDDTGTTGSTTTDSGTTSGDTRETGLEECDTGDASVTVSGHDVGVWINIASDGTVTIVTSKAEMGQGIATAACQLVAEELDVAWENVTYRIEAELDPYTTGRGGGTWGSLSLMAIYDPLREAGAAARQMIVNAAASRWDVSAQECSTSNGVVSHPDHGDLDYAELAEEAGALPVPSSVRLKDPADYTIIGKPKERVDIRDHVTGAQIYGTDVVVPDMVYAAVRQCPAFGGEVANFSDLSVDGTDAMAVVAILNGVAVVAESLWVAQKVLDALDVQWSTDAAITSLSTESLFESFWADLNQPGSFGNDKGNPDQALANAVVTHEADYAVPILAHASLEPPAATAHVTSDGCEVWISTQYPSGVQSAASQVTGFSKSKCIVHSTAVGGGFGRKAETDYATQAVMIAAEIGRPVKLIWSRTEDIQHDYYRPPAVGRVTAGLNSEGKIIAWIGKTVAASLWGSGSTWGFDEVPYGCENENIGADGGDFGIPLGFFRSPGFCKYNFMIESFIDELAEAGGIEPSQLRLQNLAHNPRMLAVLEAALQAANWDSPENAGAAHGCSVLQVGNETFIAQVAEVSVDGDNAITLHKVWVAVDCGKVVNPDIVAAQMEGCVIFSIATGVYGELTIKDGTIEQANFDSYPLLKLADSPDIEVLIIESDEDPGGVAEYAVGGAIPAITNAIYKASGIRVRTLPIQKHGLS
jgi:isoquinoline 1-oxidoreductase beta subunit